MIVKQKEDLGQIFGNQIHLKISYSPNMNGSSLGIKFKTPDGYIYMYLGDFELDILA